MSCFRYVNGPGTYRRCGFTCFRWRQNQRESTHHRGRKRKFKMLVEAQGANLWLKATCQMRCCGLKIRHQNNIMLNVGALYRGCKLLQRCLEN